MDNRTLVILNKQEILGWLIDGAAFTIQLMPDKCIKIAKLIKKCGKMKFCLLQQFQELAGKLQHTLFGILGGKGSLFSPTIYRALQTTSKQIPIKAQLKASLKDWWTLVQHLGAHPTPVQFLVSEYPNYIQYTNACKFGAGGIITPGLDSIEYWVWQFEWPKDTQDEMITKADPTGNLTINDLELTGLVLGWLVLKNVCANNLLYKQIGSFCDNPSAISWTYKGSTSTSIAAARLLRLLFICQRF